MSRLDEAKKKYEEVPIPAELNLRIQNEIIKSARNKESDMRKAKMYDFRKALRNAGVAVAAVCALFVGGLNSSQVFAAEAAELPIIGMVAKVLTFRSYETNTDDIAIAVEIPSIEVIEQNTGLEVDELNQEILDRCNDYVDNAMTVAKEYRTAFLETGGSQEEWAAHNVKISVDYEIKNQSSDYLSFIVKGSQNWSGAYTENRYYNINLGTGEYISLEDMLGADYIDIANDSIRDQIAEREKNGEVFFTAEEGGFTTISEATNFYINENGYPVIVFEKYEIAPGAMGEVEFEIGGN